MLIQVVFVAVVAVARASPLLHEPRILGGQDTTIEEHPYQVSIERDGQHNCGGSIYSPTHIVTAAHCITEVSTTATTVRVGSTFRQKGGFVYGVKELLPSPRFGGFEGLNMDVGVIVLNASITYGPTVQPIKLVGLNQEPKHGEMLEVTGWGLTRDDGTDSRAEKLQLLRAPYINKEYCQKSYSKAGVTDEMVCFGGGGNDKGVGSSDSGGPLVNKKGELVGIVSWSHSHLRRGYPTVFANVASPAVREFIELNTV